MGSREHLQYGDPRTHANAMELWSSGELGDEESTGGAILTAASIVGVLVALAAFFVAFAPPV